MKQRIIEGRADGVLRFADAALSSARSAASLTNRLLAFAHKQPLDARALDINERIRSLEDLLRRTIGERITLSFDFTAGPAVARVDVSQFERAAQHGDQCPRRPARRRPHRHPDLFHRCQPAP